MAEKTINVNLPKATEASKSIEIIEAVKTTVANGDVVTVEKAFENKDNSFFLVLEGECFLSIDNENYIIKPGQLAYLPKGKRRAYTHISKSFSMYEMAFSAT